MSASLSRRSKSAIQTADECALVSALCARDFIKECHTIELYTPVGCSARF